MTDAIWNVFASRMRFETAGVDSRISRAATRPPPIFLQSVCEITPLSDSDSITRICSWRSAGNWSMMRSMVLGAVVVCSVPNTRCPVSAVSIAIDDRFEIAQLADEHDVGVLPQRRAERVLERRRVHADLPLRDEHLLVLMHELDRVLDRDDVVGARAIDEVDRARRASSTSPTRWDR